MNESEDNSDSISTSSAEQEEIFYSMNSSEHEDDMSIMNCSEYANSDQDIANQSLVFQKDEQTKHNKDVRKQKKISSFFKIGLYY